MNPYPSLQLRDLPDGAFERLRRRPEYRSDTLPNHLHGVMPEAMAERLGPAPRPSNDYLVWLDRAEVLGTRAIVSMPDGVFHPSTIPPDWQDPVTMYAPRDVVLQDFEAALIACCRNRNYYHWVLQSFAALLDMRESGLMPEMLVISAHTPWSRAYLELTDVDPDACLSLTPDACVRFRRLLYSGYLSGMLGLSLPDRAIALFESFSRDVCAGQSSRIADRVYVARFQSRRRPISNEQEVCRLVRRYGFEIIEAERLSVVEQIRLFAEVDHVVAPHGAGLANLMFARRCASVTEIFQADYMHPCMLRICQAKGIEHHSMRAGLEQRVRRQHDVARLDLDLLERRLDSLEPDTIARVA